MQLIALETNVKTTPYPPLVPTVPNLGLLKLSHNRYRLCCGLPRLPGNTCGLYTAAPLRL
jgi:hypothetical protein